MPSLGAVREGALAVKKLLGGIPVNIKVKQRRGRSKIARNTKSAKIETCKLTA
jgi:hypothetical protein